MMSPRSAIERHFVGIQSILIQWPPTSPSYEVVLGVRRITAV